MRAKTFNCVHQMKLKYRGAEKVREQINGMTLGQELVFWQERTRILPQCQEPARKK